MNVSFEDKHAPKTWNDLVFADLQTAEDLHDYMQGNLFRHILLHGPIGTAKSTTAMLIAKGLTATDDPHMWNAKTPGLWDKVDTYIKSGGSNASLHGGCFYSIIDEVDQLKSDQERLSNAMSLAFRVRFIVTTNFLSSVDERLVDRCDPFLMMPPSADQWLPRARSILQAEGLIIEDSIVLSYLSGGSGSVRKVMRSLEKLVMHAKRGNFQSHPVAVQPVVGQTS